MSELLRSPEFLYNVRGSPPNCLSKFKRSLCALERFLAARAAMLRVFEAISFLSSRDACAPCKSLNRPFAPLLKLESFLQAPDRLWLPLNPLALFEKSLSSPSLWKKINKLEISCSVSKIRYTGRQVQIY